MIYVDIIVYLCISVKEGETHPLERHSTILTNLCYKKSSLYLKQFQSRVLDFLKPLYLHLAGSPISGLKAVYEIILLYGHSLIQVIKVFVKLTKDGPN